MKKTVVKIVAFLVACLFLLGIAGPILLSVGYAAPTDAKLEEMKRKEQQAIAAAQELEKKLNEASAKIYDIEAIIQKTEEEIAQIETELKAAEEAEAIQMDKFKKRMAVICERGNTSYLDFIFSSTGFSDFIDRIVIAREIAEYDNNILDEMERVKEEIRAHRDEVNAKKAKQEEEKAKLDEAFAELERETQEATAYMEDLKKDRQAYEAYLDAKAREQEEAKRRAGISGSGKADLSKISSGSYLWPTTSSYITSHFSPNRVNPVTGVLRPHTGTDVGASHGSPIWAAKGGKVIMAEYNGGYGNCVIIDHGNGVKTLYGHMSAILVSRGATVSQGQQIGRVGSTGNSTGPHLHYEILIDGTPVDPMQYY